MLKNLTDFSKVNGNFAVYTKANVPKAWKMMNEGRFGPIVVVAKPKYAFQDATSLAKWVQDTKGKPSMK